MDNDALLVLAPLLILILRVENARVADGWSITNANDLIYRLILFIHMREHILS